MIGSPYCKCYRQSFIISFKCQTASSALRLYHTAAYLVFGLFASKVLFELCRTTFQLKKYTILIIDWGFFFAGMKDEQGLWREYPSGRRVSFSHFPEFKPLHGDEGICQK